MAAKDGGDVGAVFEVVDFGAKTSVGDGGEDEVDALAEAGAVGGEGGDDLHVDAVADAGGVHELPGRLEIAHEEFGVVAELGAARVEPERLELGQCGLVTAGTGFVDDVEDAIAVHGHGEGLADADIVPGLFTEVEVDGVVGGFGAGDKVEVG